MGLQLDEDQIAALDQRTEGWIAALQLAALSMQGRTDLSHFIATFAGDDRYIVDYLVEEVLQRQSEPVRRFLLATSVLHQLTGPLCDAVTGGNGGRAVLETLERRNLLLVPLEDLVVFPDMNVTLTVDVGQEQRVLLVPRLGPGADPAPGAGRVARGASAARRALIGGSIAERGALSGGRPPPRALPRTRASSRGRCAGRGAAAS